MSLRHGWLVQKRVLHAVMMREVRTRFGRNSMGYLWAVVEPVFWVATFAAVRHFMGASPPGGMDIVSFLATGIITFILYRTTVTYSMASINGNRALLFYPQVRPFDIAIARSLLEGATLVVVLLVLLTASGLYHGTLDVEKPLEVILALSLTWLLGVGLGLFFMGVGVYSTTVERIVPIMMRPMLFISGVFFTASELPPELREPLLYNPVLHMTELVRHGWFREFNSEFVDLSYVIAWILLFGYLGLLLERFGRRRMELT